MGQPVPSRGNRTPTPITDANGMIYIHLAGRPLSEQFTPVPQRAYSAMEHAAGKLNFRHGQKKHRRGPFIAMDVGISSGNGNSVCPHGQLQRGNRQL